MRKPLAHAEAAELAERMLFSKNDEKSRRSRLTPLNFYAVKF
jgi:hypothetical protein